jgi:hypothetical protein
MATVCEEFDAIETELIRIRTFYRQNGIDPPKQVLDTIEKKRDELRNSCADLRNRGQSAPSDGKSNTKLKGKASSAKTGSVTVTVLDGLSGKPFTTATVKLADDSVSNESQYTFMEVPAGLHLCTGSAKDYQTFTMPVMVEAGKDAKVSIPLFPQMSKTELEFRAKRKEIEPALTYVLDKDWDDKKLVSNLRDGILAKNTEMDGAVKNADYETALKHIDSLSVLLAKFMAGHPPKKGSSPKTPMGADTTPTKWDDFSDIAAVLGIVDGAAALAGAGASVLGVALLPVGIAALIMTDMMRDADNEAAKSEFKDVFFDAVRDAASARTFYILRSSGRGRPKINATSRGAVIKYYNQAEVQIREDIDKRWDMDYFVGFAPSREAYQPIFEKWVDKISQDLVDMFVNKLMIE